MLLGLRLVLYQVMGLKGSDMAQTLAAAAPTPQNHAQGGAGVCVLFAAGPGGHGAGMRPLSDTANMGGGAVKTWSSKSHAQSLKDKKFG